MLVVVLESDGCVEIEYEDRFAENEDELGPAQHLTMISIVVL